MHGQAMHDDKKWERRATSIFYRFAFATFAPIITNIQCSSNKQKDRMGEGENASDSVIFSSWLKCNDFLMESTNSGGAVYVHIVQGTKSGNSIGSEWWKLIDRHHHKSTVRQIRNHKYSLWSIELFKKNNHSFDSLLTTTKPLSIRSIEHIPCTYLPTVPNCQHTLGLARVRSI